MIMAGSIGVIAGYEGGKRTRAGTLSGALRFVGRRIVETDNDR